MSWGWINCFWQNVHFVWGGDLCFPGASSTSRRWAGRHLLPGGQEDWGGTEGEIGIAFIVFILDRKPFCVYYRNHPVQGLYRRDWVHILYRFLPLNNPITSSSHLPDRGPETPQQRPPEPSRSTRIPRWGYHGQTGTGGRGAWLERGWTVPRTFLPTYV